MRCALYACATALAGFLLTLPASAASPSLSVGRGVVCDTPEEVEAVVTPGAQSVADRIEAVNKLRGSLACSVVTAMFYRGEEAKTVLAQQGAARITKVRIVGVQVGKGWQVAAPIDQYVAIVEPATSV